MYLTGGYGPVVLGCDQKLNYIIVTRILQYVYYLCECRLLGTQTRLFY